MRLAGQSASRNGRPEERSYADVDGLSAAASRESRTFLGCYSFPNRVLSRYEDQRTGVPVASLVEALTAELPGVTVTYEHVPILEPGPPGIRATDVAGHRLRPGLAEKFMSGGCRELVGGSVPGLTAAAGAAPNRRKRPCESS